MAEIYANAQIVDGTGREPFLGTVKVRGGHIIQVLRQNSLLPLSTLPAGSVDLTGKYLLPAFADIHGHSDHMAMRSPDMKVKLGQGIKTEVAGCCGVTSFPNPSDPVKRRLLYEASSPILGDVPEGDWNWTDYASFREKLDSYYPRTRILFLQGLGALRISALNGMPTRPADRRETETMCRLLEQSLEQGCVGLSAGLYYSPDVFACEDELVSLLKVVARRGAMFAVHMRSESDEILSSIDEVVSLARRAECRLEISHLKVIGTKNQYLLPEVLSKIENARKEGVDVLFDQYPYNYGSTSISSMLPPRVLQLTRKGYLPLLSDASCRKEIAREMMNPDGWDSIAASVGWKNVFIEGVSIEELSQNAGKTSENMFFDLLAENDRLMTDTTETMDSLRTIMKHPLGCFGTDALYTGKSWHERSTRAGAYRLNEFWKKEQVLTLGEHSKRMSAEVCRRLGLKDIGIIADGYRAEFAVYNPETGTAEVIES